MIIKALYKTLLTQISRFMKFLYLKKKPATVQAAILDGLETEPVILKITGLLAILMVEIVAKIVEVSHHMVGF